MEQRGHKRGKTSGGAAELVLAVVSCAALAGVGWLAFGDPFGALRAGGSVPQSVAPVDAIATPVASDEGQHQRGAPIEVRYGRDIRPLLSDRCFNCHGHDPETRAAGLRLDERDAAVAERDGSRAIVPGDPDSSELWRRITSHDPDMRMPPPEAQKRPLTDEDLSLIRAWIEQGAVYEPHWAFDPPKRHREPEVRQAEWARNDIDLFVLAGMEAAGVSPSPESDAETLLRRVFLDLTGLPPTPEELDAFLADREREGDAAFERWVDRLLSSEPYITRIAERLTVPWLDAARYADTIGIHTDAGRQMWLWRDWVIDAFRSNMPYDRFITEQLAGDLIPGAGVQQRVASGFNRSHVITDEGGAIDDEYLVEYAVDRTDTASSVFLGLTMGCARCHDHKFDPISAADYYGLLAYFNSNDEPGLYSQERNPNRAFEPAMAVLNDLQRERLGEIDAELKAVEAETASPSDSVVAAREAFFESPLSEWATPRIMSAESAGATVLDVLDDRSVRASGEKQATDRYEFVYAVDEPMHGVNAVLIEALTDESDRPGRADNGNAVLTGLELVVTSGENSRVLEPQWTWADIAQAERGYRAVDALIPGAISGWAVDGHNQTGSRRMLVLLDDAFELGTEDRLAVTLRFESEWASHAFVRTRVSVGTVEPPEGITPVFGTWHRTPVFAGPARDEIFDTAFGPESIDRIDAANTFGDEGHGWAIARDIRDGEAHPFGGATPGAAYFAREIFAPIAGEMPVSLGSDDGFRLYVNGALVAENNTERGVAPDQDSAVVPLRAGRNVVVMKVINTGGPGGLYFSPDLPPVSANDLVAAALPEWSRTDDLRARAAEAWHRSPVSPTGRLYRRLDELRAEAAMVEAAAPQTMVMSELEAPRPTYVLTRGMYDHPDESRPVERGVPAVLGPLPDGAPANRLGLAQWMASPDNPLVARVAVNRFWMMLFGDGLVRTPEDFGLQGAWPTHPELLDTLAVDFREGGWDIRALLRRIVLSATYRQSSGFRPDVYAIDPENELLARYPSRRLWAEQIRDQALYLAGLLVERAGGPSVKPYQPDGLWREVSMPQSNTSAYLPGEGDQLYRRSLYTYWKRAAPPPSMRAFDAPTREFCTIDRATTDTPLQALVLWNDEQFVEAARVLAQRVLGEAEAEDDRLAALYRRCTSVDPSEQERAVLADVLDGFREGFAGSPESAASLLGVGEAMVPEALAGDEPEVAAWTMVASTVMNLYRVSTQE